MLIKALIQEIIPYVPDLVRTGANEVSALWDDWTKEENDPNMIKELTDDEIQLQGKKK